MKLLIVDDEKLTRDGLIQSVDWQSLGVDNVACADDGLHGLEVARDFHPDILLSDVRMPHMSGIEMAEILQKELPALSIIFMSGYSDKEYLKAAIRLKAVRYVEKPIDLDEINEVVLEAIAEVKKTISVSKSSALSLSLSRSALASGLLSMNKSEHPLPVPGELAIDFPTDEKVPFFTFLISFHRFPSTSEELERTITPAIDKVLGESGLKEIHANRQGFLFFYHVWNFKDFSDSKKEVLGARLVEALNELSLCFHIVFGENVLGAHNICNSYNSAVIELQNVFFHENNTYCIYKHQDHYDTFLDLKSLDAENQLSQILLHKDEEQANAFLKELFDTLLSSKNILPNQIMDLYYKLFHTIKETYRMLYSRDEEALSEDYWKLISGCASLYELHVLLSEKCNLFFSQTKEFNDSNTTIGLIKDYISHHFQDESLSIKDISEHVFLSSSYVCTLFKNETGQTLNQYLTDYRIEKAKQLLANPRYKITNISTQVGYSNGNYFGKIFKKQVGMSPSEYRDKMMGH